MTNNFDTNAIYSISRITKKIKEALENNLNFNNIWINGEVYNLTYHSSGHIYFSMKDDKAVISVVFFKYANRKLKFKLENGMSIFALGSITVFEKRGSYQINVLDVKLEGVGELQKRIEQLRKKLQQENIFDPSHKKSLPLLPKRIGIVTSPTGAAIRDIIKIVLTRFPNIELVIAPAKVQGDDAAESIVQGIVELNNPRWNIDIIIAGRGGGSFEDLMPFNEEDVVRAVYESKVPVISAVGHQVDHPLTDDAADIHAATPSVAAELAVPFKKDFTDEIIYYTTRINNIIERMFREFKLRISNILNKRIFKEPRELINFRELFLSDIENRIISSMKENIADCKSRLLEIGDINKYIEGIIKNKSYSFNITRQALDNLSPLKVMERGYSITKNFKGNIIKNIDMVETGDEVKVQFVNGSIGCLVNSKEVNENFGKTKKRKS